MKKYIKILIISLLLLGSVQIGYSQAFPSGTPGTPAQDTEDNPAAPINGYVLYLLIGGAIYGYKKLK